MALSLGAALASVPAVVSAQEAASRLPSSAAPLVFRGVTVIDVREGRRQPNQTVVIVGNRIQALGRTGAVPVPRGARVVDARGKYLIPGLWDMHAHPRGYEDVAYPLFIANGVTGVRDAGSNTPLATLGQWKREIAAGTRIGPRLFVAGPRLYEGGTADTAVTAWFDELTMPHAAFGRVVDSLKAAGADFLKTYGFSREGYFALAAEARRAGMLFGGHLPNEDRGKVDGREASDSGATFLDHEPYFLDETCQEAHPNPIRRAACAAAAQRLQRHNTWVVLDPPPSRLAGQSEEASYARLRIRARLYWWSATLVDTNTSAIVADSRVLVREPTSIADWAADEDSSAWHERWGVYFARAHAAGVPMLVGSDLGMLFGGAYLLPGFALHEVLAHLVLMGFTPLAALQLATLNPARALHATDSLGTVESGKVADLVLLDADPLSDIWHTTQIRAVVANGRYYDRTALDRLLATAAELAQHHPCRLPACGDDIPPPTPR